MLKAINYLESPLKQPRENTKSSTKFENSFHVNLPHEALIFR